jgi:hypothetical protein
MVTTKPALGSNRFGLVEDPLYLGSKMISTLYQGLGLAGCVSIPTEALV